MLFRSHTLMPFAEIKAAVSSGIRNDWEMAEHFGVPREFVKRAFEIYRREGLCLA